MSILVFGWVFCILSHSDPVLFTNAFVIVVVGVLGSYLIHEIGHWLALSVTSQCREAQLMGFDGKTLIHPGQVGPANEVFAPDAEEVAEARGIIDAWENGNGSGVVTYQGRMIENLHVDTARRALAMAEAIEARG